MIKKLAVIFILSGNISFAQLPTQQRATQFDKFINKPGIEWAAYINDTIRFQKINLNILLLNRLKNAEIKASLPIGSGSYQADQVSYMTKKDIADKLLYTSDHMAVFDSVGNLVNEEKKIALKIDTADFTLTDVTQILYVENGLLKTYTAWVAPMIPVKTSTGVYLGDGDFFSACFNFNYNYHSPGKNKIIWLSRAKREISLDSFDVRSKLKELYGRNLIQTLWPYILKNMIQVFDYGKNIRIKPGDLNTNLINEAKVPVPVYDSTGKQVGNTFAKEPLLPEIFTSMELVQDWYYDSTGNIVFTTIRELYLYAKKWTANGEDSEPSPILKIVFN